MPMQPSPIAETSRLLSECALLASASPWPQRGTSLSVAARASGADDRWDDRRVAAAVLGLVGGVDDVGQSSVSTRLDVPVDAAGAMCASWRCLGAAEPGGPASVHRADVEVVAVADDPHRHRPAQRVRRSEPEASSSSSASSIRRARRLSRPAVAPQSFDHDLDRLARRSSPGSRRALRRVRRCGRTRGPARCGPRARRAAAPRCRRARAPGRRRSVMLSKNVWTRASGCVVSWGTPTRPTAPPGRAMLERRHHRLRRARRTRAPSGRRSRRSARARARSRRRRAR